MAISISNIYEMLGKGGTGSPGDNLSLADCIIGTTPAVDKSNLSAEYNKFGNSWGYNPTGDNTISMGNISSYYSAGDFGNGQAQAAPVRFKFTPPSSIAADLIGDSTSYPRTFPYNIGQLGVKMNNTNVSAGGISGTYSYPVNGYTTWTSVAAGQSYKIPNAGGTSATIAFWFKPTVQGTLRNFFWSDIDAIGDVNPYRGWWLQFNTTGTVGFSRGDGTGAASTDRYSFTTNGVFASGYWQFCVIQISNNENTINVGTNFAWCYRYDTRTSSYGWVSGASFLSGAGGAMAYSGDSGTETTNCMAFNPLGNTSNGLVMDVGHVYIFNGELPYNPFNSTEYQEYIRVMTDGYT